MTKKRYMTVMIAVLVTALFVVPGIAFSKGGGGGKGGGNGTQSPPPDNPPCDSDNHLVRIPKGLLGKCGGGSSSTGGQTTNGTNGTTNGGSSSTSTSTTQPPTTTTTTGNDVCVTDGVLGTKGLGINAGDDRTIGQIVWDELGLVVQDPQIPEGGPLSGPLYDGLIQIPLGGLETPVAAEVGCLLNNLSL